MMKLTYATARTATYTSALALRWLGMNLNHVIASVPVVMALIN